jgi:hypothetical protein
MPVVLIVWLMAAWLLSGVLIAALYSVFRAWERNLERSDTEGPWGNPPKRVRVDPERLRDL